MAIKIGIVGYGNLGKGVLCGLKQTKDLELVALFTRRNPDELNIQQVNVQHISKISEYKGKIDVLILCGGSATDLPQQSPELLKDFCIIDSFDTHANIPQHYQKLNEVGKQHNTLALLSVGWDPGLFSLARILFNSVAPVGKDYTFWGKGVSQGHSDAIRRIKGVKNAVQYTIPKEDAILKVKSGIMPELETKDKHLRECFVVLEDNADAKAVEQEIKQMPNYFADYETIVHFISEQELKEQHSAMPHGGFVLRSAKSANNNNFLMEFALKLDSNPEFTASVMLAYARAVYKMYKQGNYGAITVFDIPFKYLSTLTEEEQRKQLL